MAILKLNNTTVLTETNGVASIPSTVKFPAGHVIKKHYVEYNSQYQDLNCLNNLIYLNFQLDINPVSENSKFFIIANINAAAAMQHNYLTLRLYQTSPVNILLRGVQPMSFSYPYTFPTIMTYHHTPNTNNLITYKIGYIDTNNDSGDLYINQYNTNSIVQTTSINVFEFAS